MIDKDIKLIAIVGPTASGKSDLALDLAERFNGEIVCADSRSVYREMDIGTAKPTVRDQQRVRHHLLDVIDPGERLSAGAFKDLAEAAIRGIVERGRVPFLVGGSGLYVDAVLFDYGFPAEADDSLRTQLDAMSDTELRELLAVRDLAAFETIDLQNRRRVIRAIETAGQARTRRATMRPQTLVLGMALNKEVAQKRVTNRVRKMLDEGFIEEVRRIGETYGWDSPALSVSGYRGMKDIVLGRKSMEEGVSDVVREHMALYKKQVTWFKRNPEICWLEDRAKAEELVEKFLSPV